LRVPLVIAHTWAFVVVGARRVIGSRRGELLIACSFSVVFVLGVIGRSRFAIRSCAGRVTLGSAPAAATTATTTASAFTVALRLARAIHRGVAPRGLFFAGFSSVRFQSFAHLFVLVAGLVQLFDRARIGPLEHKTRAFALTTTVTLATAITLTTAVTLAATRLAIAAIAITTVPLAGARATQ
jgi:hypothetical protein